MPAELVRLTHVGVMNRRSNRGLVDEHARVVFVPRHLAAHQFQRDGSSKARPGGPRGPDLTHTAARQERCELIAPDDVARRQSLARVGPHVWSGRTRRDRHQAIGESSIGQMSLRSVLRTLI